MIEHILEVKISNEIFGIDSNKIIHILKIPPITKVPITNTSIKGVCVILGKIISVVDISSILELNEVDFSNEDAKILTISDDSALVVDEVLEMVEVDPENFEEVEQNFIVGFLRDKDKIVQILDVDKILSKITTKQFEPKKIEKITPKPQKEMILNENFERYLFFNVCDEEFGLKISLIREIIFIPEITPTTNHEQVGIITLRDEVVPVIDMNKLFDFDEVKITPKSRSIVVTNDNHSLALIVDEVEEVKDINQIDIEQINSEKISGIYKGDKIVSIINENFIEKIVDNFNISEEKIIEEQKGGQMVEVVVFKIENEEFAFDIKDIQEIIKYEKPIFFPQAPKFVKGLLNLRGSVIPIISLPEKLSFEEKITEKTKIIVCEISEEKIGFIVDDVSDIMFIEKDKMSKIENKDSIFDEVINLEEERVILKIDINKLFTDEEIENLKLTKEL